MKLNRFVDLLAPDKEDSLVYVIVDATQCLELEEENEKSEKEITDILKDNSYYFEKIEELRDFSLVNYGYDIIEVKHMPEGYIVLVEETDNLSSELLDFLEMVIQPFADDVLPFGIDLDYGAGEINFKTDNVDVADALCDFALTVSLPIESVRYDEDHRLIAKLEVDPYTAYRFLKFVENIGNVFTGDGNALC